MNELGANLRAALHAYEEAQESRFLHQLAIVDDAGRFRARAKELEARVHAAEQHAHHLETTVAQHAKKVADLEVLCFS